MTPSGRGLTERFAVFAEFEGEILRDPEYHLTRHMSYSNLLKL